MCRSAGHNSKRNYYNAAYPNRHLAVLCKFDVQAELCCRFYDSSHIYIPYPHLHVGRWRLMTSHFSFTPHQLAKAVLKLEMATPDSASGEEAPEVELRTPRPITERFQTAVAKIRTLPKEGKTKPAVCRMVLCACVCYFQRRAVHGR